jgi:hypothetical protein
MILSQEEYERLAEIEENYQLLFLAQQRINSVRPQVAKGIQKVSQKPVSIIQGGYGKPLGNKYGVNLAGLFKIKFLFQTDNSHLS